MTDRNSKKSTYTPNMGRPSERKKRNRSLPTILLCVLIPPVGLALLWRKGVFMMRGRVLLTAISTIEMACVFALLLPPSVIQPEVPVASVPVAVTTAPDDGTTTALTNLEQVLAERARAEAEANGDPLPIDENDPEAQEKLRQEQEAILNTTVYAVYNNAKMYHAREVCGTQSNRRQLTVQEALLEGLGACPNCNPPVFTGY
ncbi:MAG: hypothetical protein Q4D43_08405 [Clostridia bacterium]|nr:hypothetical protein [Clostridia bacterium]